MQSAVSKAVFFSVVCMIFFSCIGTAVEKENAGNENSRNSSTPADTGIYGYYVSGIPFPFKLLESAHQADAAFGVEVLNPPANASKYQEMDYKALNLGIYGADIAYVVTCSQFAELNVYLKAGSRLAELLGVPASFSEGVLQKFTEYHDEKDTLIRLIYSSYKTVDESLHSSEQGGYAAYIVAGCWIEAMYIATQAADKVKNINAFYKTISEQRFFVTNILNLLNEYKTDKLHDELVLRLNEIKVLLNDVQSDNDFNNDQVLKVKQQVQQLRNKITDAILI